MNYFIPMLLSLNLVNGNASSGQTRYQTVCIACHNTNPAEVGPIGPAIKGSSWELIFTKVTTGLYPLGYKPQRDTHIMPIFELTESDAKDLAEYLK